MTDTLWHRADAEILCYSCPGPVVPLEQHAAKLQVVSKIGKREVGEPVLERDRIRVSVVIHACHQICARLERLGRFNRSPLHRPDPPERVVRKWHLLSYGDAHRRTVIGSLIASCSIAPDAYSGMSSSADARSPTIARIKAREAW